MIMRAVLFLIPTMLRLGRKQFLSTDQRPEDHEALKRLRESLILWCVSEQFLVKRNDTYQPNIAKDDHDDADTSLRNYIYTLNLKQLTHRPYLLALLQRLKDTPFDFTTSRLIDLHIQLITEIDPRFLNLYINKLLYALESVNEESEDMVSWQEIFETYPFIWLLFPIQQLLRQCATITP